MLLARGIIKENHPLNGTPLYQVYPALNPCKSCISKVGGGGDGNEPLLVDDSVVPLNGTPKNKKIVAPVTANKKKVAPVNDGEEKEDPFAILGFGMVAYKNLIFTFFLFFLVVSVIMTPALVFYKSGSGIIGGKSYGTWSLGNLGYSSS
jgi:hypothetical protein